MNKQHILWYIFSEVERVCEMGKTVKMFKIASFYAFNHCGTIHHFLLFMIVECGGKITVSIELNLH